MARTAAGRSRRAATLTAPSSPTAGAPVGNIAGMAGRPAGAAGPFVGRARELTAVAGLIAETDRTGVVLVGGEAGLGKTRLVEALTGIDCDRWDEEKTRGITIDLGFAHLEEGDLADADARAALAFQAKALAHL